MPSDLTSMFRELYNWNSHRNLQEIGHFPKKILIGTEPSHVRSYRVTPDRTARRLLPWSPAEDGRGPWETRADRPAEPSQRL